jgi:oligopeptide/dipeptide ABC transporter ATP-binding protein
MVDDIVVMYGGQVVEHGSVHDVLLNPTAPYTVGLIESIPSVDKRGGRLHAIKGVVASPFNMPPACRFEPRCPYAWELCREVPPELIPSDGTDQFARCHLHSPEGAERRPRLEADRERVTGTGARASEVVG